MNLKQIPSLLYESAREWHNDRVSMYAAALAYYTIFSITPMVIFVVFLASLVLRREDARQWLFLSAEPFVGPEVMGAIRSIVENIQDTPATLIATLIGLVTFFLGATRIVTHLRNTLDSIWEVPPKPGGGVWSSVWGAVRGRFSGFLIVIVAGFLFILLAVVSAVLSAAGSYLDQLAPALSSIITLSDFLVTMIIGTILFALMFKFLPDVRLAWSDVWIGAEVTALLFFIGKQLFGFYFGSGAIRSAYGAAGSLVVFILWIYYTAQILFFGAEFTQVYTRRFGSKIRRESRMHRERVHVVREHAAK